MELMKNNFSFFSLIFFFIFFFIFEVNANEVFNFNVSEIEITDNGKKIKGIKRGKISTNEGLIIEADSFEFDKARNLLVATGNIRINEKEQNLIILADKISYNKNKEIITGEGNINYLNDLIEIKANKFKYVKSKKIIIAEKDVLAKDKLRDLIILSDKITYFKIQEKILTEGITKAAIHSEYEFVSKNVSN